MRDNFNRQLDRLKEELITMGAMCEEAISLAVKYLTEKDNDLREQAFNTDRLINRKEHEIEQLCMRLIRTQQPVATDLRTISIALKMIWDMKRIGDQTADLIEVGEYLDLSEFKSKVHIVGMAKSTVEMVTSSIESFVKQSLDLANDVIKTDDIIDEYFIKVKEEIISAGKDGKYNIESLVDLLMAAKYFERIGDHAENIAHWVVYYITGEEYTEE